MHYSLDTNACIRYLKGNSSQLLTKVRSITPSDITVCAIVRAELFYGAAKSHNPAKTLTEQLNFVQLFTETPFDEKAAKVYGQERARLERLGTIIGPNDLLIASIALANNMILVTHNVREFSRISGLGDD